MTTLPAYSAPQDRDAIVAATRAHLEREGCACVYRRGGTGDGKLITARISARPPRAAGAPAGAGGAGPGLMQAPWHLTVMAVQPGEADDGGGVGADGGVAELRVGDTLETYGLVFARPELDSVRARICGNVRLVEGAYWTAEVVP
ncbi:MAG: hypothetical protein WAZ94_13445 [Phycisphaerales bacterium]